MSSSELTPEEQRNPPSAARCSTGELLLASPSRQWSRNGRHVDSRVLQSDVAAFASAVSSVQSHPPCRRLPKRALQTLPWLVGSPPFAIILASTSARKSQNMRCVYDSTHRNFCSAIKVLARNSSARACASAAVMCDTSICRRRCSSSPCT